MPAISGNVSTWINIVIAILGVIIAGGPHIFPAYVPEIWANDIVQTAAFVVAIFGGVNAVLHVAGGPGVSPTVARALVAGAIMAACLLSIAAPTTARAATMRAQPTSASTASPFSQLNALFGSLQKFTVADLQAALADANAQTPPDTRHAGCWQALIPVAQANLVNPLPGGLGLAQGIQKVFDDESLFGSQPWKDTVATACALTVLDLGGDLNSLLSKVGVAAVAIPKL